MKKLYSLVLLLISITSLGQAPQLIPYQAIARDDAGQALANASINARFTIHDETATGTTVWQEIQTITTSALGLFTVQLGSNISLGSVNWASGSKFMQVEIDLGSGFVEIGTQQMLSVPYAIHSESSNISNNALNGFSHISLGGDTLHLANGNYLLIPGISAANNGGGSGTNVHTCGASNVHNPNRTYGTLIDQEGNFYKTIIIGNQEWMAENLKTSIYRNGDTIPTNLNNASWSSTTNGAWSYYNNNANLDCPYGKLYNWFACVDERNLCPSGWHVPADYEWTILTDFLGGVDIAGGKLKTTGTVQNANGFWQSPNAEATNFNGFSAIPYGIRESTFAEYYNFGTAAYFWSSSVDNTTVSWCRQLYNGSENFFISSNQRQDGMSVRCIRD